MHENETKCCSCLGSVFKDVGFRRTTSLYHQVMQPKLSDRMSASYNCPTVATSRANCRQSRSNAALPGDKNVAGQNALVHIHRNIQYRNMFQKKVYQYA